jgi:hypothetical protein
MYDDEEKSHIAATMVMLLTVTTVFIFSFATLFVINKTT